MLVTCENNCFDFLKKYRARNYDSGIGRFIQEDAFAGAMTMPITIVNKYVYAANNPSVNVDPSGKNFLSSASKELGKFSTNLWRGGLWSREAQAIYGVTAGVTLTIIGGGITAAAPIAGTTLMGIGVGLAAGSISGYFNKERPVYQSALLGAAYGGAVGFGAGVGFVGATNLAGALELGGVGTALLGYGGVFAGALAGNSLATWVGAKLDDNLFNTLFSIGGLAAGVGFGFGGASSASSSSSGSSGTSVKGANIYVPN